MPNHPRVIKTNKEERLSKKDWEHAEVIIVKGRVIQERGVRLSISSERDATPEELAEAKQK